MLRNTIPILLALGFPLLSQVDGRVNGSVTDPAGAAVPNARIMLALPGSSIPVLETTTTTAGLFQLIGVRADLYDLRVEANGFAQYKIERIEVDSARERAVPPIKLEIASVAASVDVAALPNVETGNAEVSDTITHEQLQRLPSRGRDPLLFLSTQPGVAIVGTGNVVDGQRGSYTEYRLDGISVDDEYIHGSTISSMLGNLLLDQIGEITVATSNISAALGGAAQVSMTTPSGTNQYHGSAYWYNQNAAFTSNTWFNNSLGNSVVPPLNQNQAGITVGGPVLKSRLLFYANVEELQNRQHVYFPRTILSDDARQGIFTYQDARGNVQKANVLQLAGVGIDPYIRKLLDQVPTGIKTFGSGDSQPGLIKNTGGLPVPIGLNHESLNATGKIDYIPSPQNVFQASYLRNHVYSENPGNGGYSIVPSLTSDSTYQLVSAAWEVEPVAKVHQ